MLFKKKRKGRVCVIGLDGVPHSLLKDLVGRGVMPAAAGLFQKGSLQRMKASLPEISAVSWSDFMTGKNSGQHGIFGFTDLKPGTYDLRFPNFLDLKAPPLWERLSEQNKRSIVINQPATYPARRLNGILVSGFVAVDLAKAVYPPQRKSVLEDLGYVIDVDTVKIREDPSFLWSELSRTMEGRKKAFDLFWKEDWDYFEFVITGTDRLHHFKWNAGGDTNHPDHEKFLDYYRKVDDLIGEIAASFLKLTGGDQGLYFLSDHGFCGIKQEVYLNSWLEKEGFLRFAAAHPRGLEDISDEAAAFALDPNRIYLNLKGKFPKGSVSASEAGPLKDDIRQKIEKLEYGGQKVVRRVFDARDVYSGPHVPSGPDLIVLSEPGFDLKGSVKKRETFGRSSFQGMHTWDDAFFWAVEDAGPGLAISDLSDIVLRNYS